MKIALLGATGRTGKHLLELALQRGHTVNVLVRDKQKLVSQMGQKGPISQSGQNKLIIFEGYPLDKKILEQTITGCEAIVSALNISRTSDFPWAKLRTPKDFLSQVMKLIIDIAPSKNIRRVIFTTAWGVAETKKDLPGWFKWLIDKSNMRYPYADHEKQEELAKQSNLLYTSVRPVVLINSQKIKQPIVTFNNDPKPKLMISRRSVASFMLDVLEQNSYVREMPVISGK
jgi:putative NADH-flavin reductase